MSLSSFLVDVARLSLWLVILTAVFVPLERLFARVPGPVLRREIGIDLGYYFLNSVVPAAVIALPMALLATMFQRAVPVGFHAAVHALPLWLSIPIGLVVADIGSYWGHRLMHASPRLWHFHAVHHSAGHMDFLVNTRAHPVDMVVTRLSGLVPLYILGLGSAGPAGSVLPVVITIIGTFAGFFIHANLRWRLGPIEWMVATPAFHHWHHTRTDHIDRNFAATFPWLDRVFGTHYLPDHFPAEYGTSEPQPTTLLGQLVEPISKASAARR